FEGIVVSGAEKMAKPDKEIFEVILRRYGIEASKALFIDDSQANIETAKGMGFHTIHLTSDKNLPEELANTLA
ncbi:MAG: HAD-IA family hydrolase, partial [Bacteroidota bacterium]